MIRIIKILFVSIFVLLTFDSKVCAMSISISDLPKEINQSDEVETMIALSCNGCGDSFIRGVFYPSGTNYFGLTQNNNGDWIGSESDRSKYFKIAKTDLIDASWSGKLRVKPDLTDSAYQGPGEYLFKVGRYTSSTDSGADWSNELAIRITGPTFTPTPTPTPTQTSTSTPVKTSTPSPTKTPTPSPTKTPTPKPSPTESPNDVVSTDSGNVLGMEIESGSPAPSPESHLSFVSENKNKIMAIGFICLGMSLIGGSLYFALKTSKSNKLQNDI
jgi:hypothetical protein